MEKKLPKNWVECALNELALVQSGGTPSRGNKAYWNGNIPWIKISDIKDLYVDEATEYITEEGLANSAARLFPKGTILFTIFATIGRIGILNIEATTNQAIAGITPSNLINHKYLTYSLIDLSNSLQEQGKGVAQKNINQAILKSTLIPLPPLAEQNRIVAKLDALFAQLETIKTSMAKVPLLLKDFRQQVLNQAVTGKLTEEWRKGKELEDWKEYILLDVIIEKPRNGFSPKAVEYETPVKSLTLSATTSGKFNPLHVKYLEIEAPNLTSHLWLKKDDILIQRSNSLDYVGTAAIYDGTDFDFIYPDIMMKVRANDKILNKFLFYSLSSKTIKEYFKNNASGTAGNMPKINQETVSRTPINLPPLEEQQEIVSRVESLFAKAYVIEKQYETLKAKIESLPQAILHKAFKGELTEQLDSDGDARELLKEIEGLKEAGKTLKSKKTKSVAKKV